MRAAHSTTAMPCRIPAPRPCLRSMHGPHRPSRVGADPAHARGPNEIPCVSGNRTGAPQVLRPHRIILSARMHGLRGRTEQSCISDLNQDADLSTSNQAMLDSTKTETAIFGLGRPEVTFASLQGVILTRVGYTGGNTKSPTYKSVCKGDGHTEAIKVVYDPSLISYEDLLRTFWQQHRPFKRQPKAQYLSVIWTTTEEQRQSAVASLAEAKASHDKELFVSVAEAMEWTDAEEYHQKFIQKREEKAAKSSHLTAWR